MSKFSDTNITDRDLNYVSSPSPVFALKANSGDNLELPLINMQAAQLPSACDRSVDMNRVTELSGIL